ncbi:MAG: SPOR domain-containing protein [Pseudomonadota bacterium]|nr:SPOR domain-containing protein [Pseudomonadota bacterium]
MGQNYKSKRRPVGAVPKAPGAISRSGGGGRRSAGFSGWTGAACGLAVGLAIAGIVYIKERPIEAPYAQNGKPMKRRSRSVEAGESEAADAAGDEGPKTYDFYSKLPKFEVVVPEKDKEVKPDLRAMPETRRGTYVLQAGSYKNFADADRIRAQLALQGVESKIQKVSVDQDTWHRIRIGPISQLNELNRLRNILRKTDVDVLVIRVGD